MNQYMIRFHNVPHEIAMYVEEVKLYGDVTHYREGNPTYIWIDSYWEIDILEAIIGVKKVWPKRYDNTPISVVHDRNWTELEGTRWAVNPQ